MTTTQNISIHGSFAYRPRGAFYFVVGVGVDIGDIRRENLRALIRDLADNNVAKFVEMAGLESHAAILHITAPRPTRNLGARLARKIEVSLELEAGWMDQNHSTETTSVRPEIAERMQRALKFYTSVEKLSAESRDALEQFIDSLHGKNRTNRRKKKPEAAKR